jgi:hypothetical protein
VAVKDKGTKCPKRCGWNRVRSTRSVYKKLPPRRDLKTTNPKTRLTHRRRVFNPNHPPHEWSVAYTFVPKLFPSVYYISQNLFPIFHNSGPKEEPMMLIVSLNRHEFLYPIDIIE